MKTYLFDFDGTLVDSMPTYVSVMKGILDDAEIPYGDDLVKIITPLGYSGTADYFIALGLKGERDEIIFEMNKRAAEKYKYEIEAKKSVAHTLLELKKSGNSLNVLTASPHSMLDPCLKRLGLFDLFDNVWSCDDFGTTKSNPEIYKMAAERLGISTSELIFLDDNPGADKTAKAAGAYVIGVFDESSAEYEKEMRAVCDGYVYDFSELL